MCVCFVRVCVCVRVCVVWIKLMTFTQSAIIPHTPVQTYNGVVAIANSIHSNIIPVVLTADTVTNTRYHGNSGAVIVVLDGLV